MASQAFRNLCLDMITPHELIDLGRQVHDELTRMAGELHVKDDGQAELANAADAVGGKADEIRSLLLLPGMQEKLVSSAALMDAETIPPSSSLEVKRNSFERIYHALDSTIAGVLRAVWVGNWELNDNGSAAKLTITDRSAQSTNAASPNLEITYLIADRRVYHGWVRSMDLRWHHIHFFVSLGGISRNFDAYLLKWDKRKMAGVSEGQGFYATKV